MLFCIFRKLHHYIIWKWIFPRWFWSLFCEMSCLGKGLVVGWVMDQKAIGELDCMTFSKYSFSLTTSLFGVIITDIPRVLEIFPVVLEIEKEALLLGWVYQMPGPLGTFINGFILLINKMTVQHKIWLLVSLILIRCCLRVLPKLIL